MSASAHLMPIVERKMGNVCSLVNALGAINKKIRKSVLDKIEN